MEIGNEVLFLHAELETAVRACKEAGALLRRGLKTDKKVHYKGAINLVTSMDLESESVVVGIIQERFPEDGIMAEENHLEHRDERRLWVVDPLDGTTNYAHGYPHFAVSVALLRDGVPEVGVVYDPVRDELFSALKGHGAHLGLSNLRVSTASTVNESLLATGFPYDLRQKPWWPLESFRRFALRAQGVRRDGSAALNLCYVAAGRLDGFWEIGLHPWDVAAGALMVQEAGGQVSSDFQGRAFDPFHNEILASNGLIHQEMIDILTP